MEGTDEEIFQSYTVVQLRDELSFRYLPTTGLKQDLIARLIEDNKTKLQYGTMDTLRQEKVRRQSQMTEIENMRQQLRELQLRPPGTSTDNTNITLTEVLCQLAQTQEIIAHKMSNSPTFQVYSTSDTSNAIPLFGGNRYENASDWVRQVDRIASLAKWADNLTMVNASMRLRGPAHNWNTVCGKKIESWAEWKEQFVDRFNIKMSFAEFIQYQSKRTLRTTETLTEYIYVKNAMLEKSPSMITELDRWIDHATRYVMAKPTSSLAAADVIHTIEHDIIYQYGPPLTYISDKAPCFMSQATQRFFTKFGIEHLPTTPYSPNCNGLLERANATIIATLTKMALENNTDWDKLLPNALLAINTARQKTTGYSPFYLLHGYHPRIPPNEIHIGTIQEDIDRTQQLDLLDQARQTACTRIESQHNKNKAKFDLRKLEHNFKEGDIVLYTWPQAQDDKLTPKFKGPYRILRKIGSVCYEIQNVNQPSKKKVVHVQFLKTLASPPILDSFSAFSAHNDDQPYNDDQPHNDDNSQDDQMDEDDRDTDLTHNPDDDGTGQAHTRQYVTTRGRITRKPVTYDV